jgi:multidrug efflux pump subunit AcrA (membrane-fusion protein)
MSTSAITLRRGQLLAEISAPELDHLITQAQATLALSQAALNQAKAKRESASVTWDRDSNLAGQGWITSQQADTERLNLKAQEVAVAEANIRAQQALLEVLLQQKAYQRVVAPFDGIVVSSTTTTWRASEDLRYEAEFSGVGSASTGSIAVRRVSSLAISGCPVVVSVAAITALWCESAPGCENASEPVPAGTLRSRAGPLASPSGATF